MRLQDLRINLKLNKIIESAFINKFDYTYNFEYHNQQIEAWAKVKKIAGNNDHTDAFYVNKNKKSSKDSFDR